MKKHTVVGMGLVILMLILTACPAQAFTAKSLDITVQDNADAIITFGYDLSWFENIAVYSRLVDPAAELAKALNSQFSKNVAVLSVSRNQVQLWVPGFATREENNGIVTFKTPMLSFTNAQNALNRYWFAPFISPDFSPEVTRVSFPDGYSEVFYNQDQIPYLSHDIA